MRIRHVIWAIGFVSFLAAAAYFFIYLYRWEWNRADIAGTLLIVTEVALVGGLTVSRLGRIGTRHPPIDSRVSAAAELLEQNRPPRRNTFAWLRPEAGGLGVFIPVLIGAGAVISGLAWIVEWAARRTVQPGMEQLLAGTVAGMMYPSDHLVDLGVLPVADSHLLAGPHPSEGLR